MQLWLTKIKQLSKFHFTTYYLAVGIFKYCHTVQILFPSKSFFNKPEMKCCKANFRLVKT